MYGMAQEGEKRVQVHVPYAVLLDSLDEIISEGIDPEVFMDVADLEEASGADLEALRSELARAELRITMHGPYTGVNPGSADESVRLHTMDVYAAAFEAASFLKPKNIVLHAGYSARRFTNGPHLWLAQSMKTWPGFVKKAESIGVTIAAENIFEKEPSTLRSLVDAIGSPNFRVCIDAGHLSVFSGVPFEEWFRVLGPLVAEVHLHDNNAGSDEHLPLGEGSIDFPLFFHLVEKYANDPVYTIEPHGADAMRRAIKAIRDYI